MATQAQLTTTTARRFHLDAASREAGRRGLQRARTALAEANARAAADRLRSGEAGHDSRHATAA